jgi:hypothetical protein
MTILSIAVCNSSSKIIFARQFLEMSRKQLEEYIVLFSRRVTQEKEVTSFETEKNRFLYYFSEPLYLVVITTLDSNVIEDLEVLKLANRLIIDLCGVGKLVDKEIVNNAWDIALALDDIISFGSFEGINMNQVKNLLQMDSAEEKEFRKIQMQREKHAKEQLHIHMREIENKRKNNTYFNDAISSEVIQCGSDVNTSSNNNSKAFSGVIGGTSSSGGVISSTKEEIETTTEKSINSNQAKKVTKSKGLVLGKKKADVGKYKIYIILNNFFNYLSIFRIENKYQI